MESHARETREIPETRTAVAPVQSPVIVGEMVVCSLETGWMVDHGSTETETEDDR